MRHWSRFGEADGVRSGDCFCNGLEKIVNKEIEFRHKDFIRCDCYDDCEEDCGCSCHCDEVLNVHYVFAGLGGEWEKRGFTIVAECRECELRWGMGAGEVVFAVLEGEPMFERVMSAFRQWECD